MAGPAPSDTPQKIAQKLLQGWAMLNDYCPNGCNVPLVRSRAGDRLCVVCNKTVAAPEEPPEPALPVAGALPQDGFLPASPELSQDNGIGKASATNTIPTFSGPVVGSPPAASRPMQPGPDAKVLGGMQQALLSRMVVYQRELEKISQNAQTADLSREMVLMQLIKDATTALANLNTMGAR